MSIEAKRLDGSRWHLPWVGFGPAHIVLCGDKGTSPKMEAEPLLPIFGWPISIVVKRPLGTEVGLSPGDFVLDGDPAPLFKKGAAHVYCDQTAAWIKMPLGTEVGLGPGEIVFDEDPAAPEKKCTVHPIFGPCLLWPNGWVDQDAPWCGGKPRPRLCCVRWGRGSP